MIPYSVGQKDGPSETDVGKGLVDATIEAGVKHFVYIGLTSASIVTNGEIPVECFDDIASLFGGLPYFPDEEGYLALNWSHRGGNDAAPFAAIGAGFDDSVHGVFLQPRKYHGKFIQGFSQSGSLDDVAKDVKMSTKCS
ncbi:hypothetical protein QQZ08_002936 [Neonectria magnoliae]|uniref:Uncharacterized protein n=1 Tax=Neonectria magnoliae TaxID=2732573 RepID=A0ABR1IBW4_9HYPO